MNFLFFTKTLWNEPPRIRHQLAKLLSDNGNTVFFFEKPLLWPNKANTLIRKHKRIRIIQYQELLHHKLRICALLHRVNAFYTIKSIENSLNRINVSKDDIIINFNYEYYFLRRIFKNNKIVTIINDEFISRALFGFQKPLKWALRKSLSMSDKAFTVSLPLQEDLKKYSEVSLLLPWADQNYVEPHHNSNRKTLLFWGYINHRIDFGLIEEILKNKQVQDENIKILFVGPIDRGTKFTISRLSAIYKNFHRQEPKDLDSLDLNEILAGIIPYRKNVTAINATTLPNKALQTLARGLPLLISGMPNFIQEPFVFNIQRKNPYACINRISHDFENIQPKIKDFVSKNTAQVRLKELFDSLPL